MSDLYLGVLLVIAVMALIFFGPELGKSMSRKFFRSRRRAAAHTRVAIRRGIRVRSRKVSLEGDFAHF